MKKCCLLLLLATNIALSQTVGLGTPTPYAVCDDDGDFIYNFDLTSKDEEITDGFAPYFIVRYYETQADSQADTNAIINPTSYVSTSKRLFVRMLNPNNPTEFGLTWMFVSVFLPPLAIPPPDMVVYQNPFTGNAKFDFQLQKSIVEANQFGIYAKFYTSQADAIADTNPISSECYTNTSNPQTIWVRSYANFEGGCFEVMSFTISVSSDTNPNPILNIPDANFKAKLLNAIPGNYTVFNHCMQGFKLDANSDGEIQTDEAARARWINVNSSNIASLEGIKQFANLNKLICYNNQLQELDVDGMYSLREVNCAYNLLTTLDFSHTRLIYLHCYYNNLVSVNIKNGMTQEVPPEFPGNWQYNPNLSLVCIDAEELASVETLFEVNGYPMSIVTSDCNLATDNFVANNGFSIYPNPANETVNVKASETMESISIYDISGRLIKDFKVENTQAELNVIAFPKGVYLMKISTNKNTAAQRFIKQ